ncbi:MAG TPA: hypothetical protein VE934_08730 [Polaromonas sp.]|uniref:hypothetical protein n=1 Tax=Polaromonas sp. TaxID=1869339 RepID=UPI002D30D9C9|nr:hypothetical protein [Polaromonas sp.]HYW57033.1 hypothetical protein [Polaromonas sp.]
MDLHCEIALLLACGFASPLPGGTNSQGWHAKRKTGDYHGHGSTDQMPQCHRFTRLLPSRLGRRVCAGQGGGTYTITKNGRRTMPDAEDAAPSIETVETISLARQQLNNRE